MKQEISPKVVIGAIAVVVLVVLVLAFTVWRAPSAPTGPDPGRGHVMTPQERQEMKAAGQERAADMRSRLHHRRDARGTGE